MAGERRLDGWRRTVEWHRHEIEILRMPEHFAGEMRRGADTGVSVAVLAVICLEKCNQFFDVARRNRWMTNNTLGVATARVTGAKSLSGSYGIFG